MQDGSAANAGNQASSHVDLGYTDRFHIPVVTSLSFSTCDSVLGDFLEFRQENQVCLHV